MLGALSAARWTLGQEAVRGAREQRDARDGASCQRLPAGLVSACQQVLSALAGRPRRHGQFGPNPREAAAPDHGSIAPATARACLELWEPRGFRGTTPQVPR